MFYNSRAFTFTQSVNVLPLTNSVTADRIGCPCVIYLSGVLKKKSRVHVKSVYRPSPLGKIAGGGTEGCLHTPGNGYSNTLAAENTFQGHNELIEGTV